MLAITGYGAGKVLKDNYSDSDMCLLGMATAVRLMESDEEKNRVSPETR